MLNVFIGWDASESVAYHVLAHSIIRRVRRPVSITPLCRDHFPFFTRKRGPLESTDFSLSRFLVPYLSGYTGYSLYMDCDMVALADIGELVEMCEYEGSKGEQAVWVCQHNYTPRTATKMDDRVQTVYTRKNWSSLMVFRNNWCRNLTPEYVNTALPLNLHRFAWAKDHEIGTLPLEWNWLVGEYLPHPLSKVLHYTLGGPWRGAYRSTDHAEEWLAEYHDMTGADFYPLSHPPRIPPLEPRSS